MKINDERRITVEKKYNEKLKDTKMCKYVNDQTGEIYCRKYASGECMFAHRKCDLKQRICLYGDRCKYKNDLLRKCEFIHPPSPPKPQPNFSPPVYVPEIMLEPKTPTYNTWADKLKACPSPPRKTEMKQEYKGEKVSMKPLDEGPTVIDVPLSLVHAALDASIELGHKAILIRINN